MAEFFARKKKKVGNCNKRQQKKLQRTRYSVVPSESLYGNGVSDDDDPTLFIGGEAEVNHCMVG